MKQRCEEEKNKMRAAVAEMEDDAQEQGGQRKAQALQELKDLIKAPDTPTGACRTREGEEQTRMAFTDTEAETASAVSGGGSSGGLAPPSQL